MTMHQLRYTGVQATTFREPGVGYVEPGATFSVDGSRLVSFMRRADIEHAGECPSPPCRCDGKPAPEPAAEPGRKRRKASDDSGTAS